MGLFDTVWVYCPTCEGVTELQSKAGDCVLADLSLETAPPEVLNDIEGRSLACGHGFVRVEVVEVLRARVAV